MKEYSISLTELRKNLDIYLGLVECGETVILIRRSKVIGRIIPEKKYIEDRMADLMKSGVGSWGGKPLSPWEPVAVNKGPVLASDLVREDRDSGDD